MPASDSAGQELDQHLSASGGSTDNRRWWLLGAGAVLLLVAVATIVLLARGSSEPRALFADVVLKDGSREPEGRRCAGTGGYADIRFGADVTVTDASGRVIGTGTLVQGIRVKRGSATTDCLFRFGIRDLPTTDFYGIEVSDRGIVTYSLDELNDANWDVDLTIGNT
jgi:hypothetical protein